MFNPEIQRMMSGKIVKKKFFVPPLIAHNGVFIIPKKSLLSLCSANFPVSYIMFQVLILHSHPSIINIIIKQLTHKAHQPIDYSSPHDDVHTAGFLENTPNVRVCVQV